MAFPFVPSPRRLRICRVVAAAVLALALSVQPSAAQGQSGFRVKVTYDGSLGPVSSTRPLCFCLFADADLQSELGCFISSRNGATFQYVSGDTGRYFVIAFLDLQRNERVDANEPFEIYNGKGAPPADAITAQAGLPMMEMTFADENLPGAATPTPTLPAPTFTPTPGPEACSGDCDASGQVDLADIVALVRIDLGAAPYQPCSGVDRSGDERVQVDEIVAAVNRSRAGCS